MTETAWGMYAYTYPENQKAIVRFEVDAARSPAPPTHQTNVRLIVRIPHAEVSPNGLPSPDANRALAEADAKIGAATQGTPHRHVAVMTYGGMKDYVFQTDQPDALASLLSAIPVPFPVELMQAEGWDFYDRRVRPDEKGWQFMSNLQLLEQLRVAGSDLAAPHLLDHTLVGPDGALSRMRAQLEPDGFRCAHEGDGRLVMQKPAHLEPEALTNLTFALTRFARDLGARYDGWGAPVVRPQ